MAKLCLVLYLLSPLLVFASKPAYWAGDVNHKRQLFCQVDCGNGWCCLSFDTCQASGDSFVCLDSVLTDASGAPSTFDAIPGGSISSLVSFLSSVSAVTLSDLPTAAATTTANTFTPAATRKTSSAAAPTSSTVVPQSSAIRTIDIGILGTVITILVSLTTAWVVL